jgi:hypothetical protein
MIAIRVPAAGTTIATSFSITIATSAAGIATIRASSARHLDDVVPGEAALEEELEDDPADPEELEHLALEPLDDGGLERLPQVVLDAVDDRGTELADPGARPGPVTTSLMSLAQVPSASTTACAALIAPCTTAFATSMMAWMHYSAAVVR